jgi:hypothetical protein
MSVPCNFTFVYGLVHGNIYYQQHARVSLSSVWLHKNERRKVPRNFGKQTICHNEKTAA